jgi:hypothetical protein
VRASLALHNGLILGPVSLNCPYPQIARTGLSYVYAYPYVAQDAGSSCTALKAAARDKKELAEERAAKKLLAQA